MVNLCEMFDSVKIVDFPNYETTDNQSYCNFKIEKNALVFTDKKITVSNYASLSVCDYKSCKNLFPLIHPDNQMIFIELWVEQRNGANVNEETIDSITGFDS